MKNQNFIYVEDNVISSETCQNIINDFHYLKENGHSFNRQESGTPKNQKADTSVNHESLLVHNILRDREDILMKNVSSHVLKYIEQYETGMFNRPFGNEYPISHDGWKIQKTRPSEGYHVWHCENGGLDVSSRFLFWILYLNDIDEGGETEFIHLSERVAPKAGRILIAPAYFTHAHRGNPPLDGDKYIATGWMSHTL